MTGLSIKNLWARKLRALTTTLAVFIGVALIAGTYILTDTMFKAFDEIFSDSLKGTDVVITREDVVRQESGEVPAFSAELLGEVKRVPGVEVAAGGIFTPGGIFDDEGETIGSEFAPKFISSLLPGAAQVAHLPRGNSPANARQASLDQAAADEAGLEIGDRFQVAGQERVRSYELVGLTKLGEASFGGAVIAELTLPEAQRVVGKVGRFDQIAVAAADGVDPSELKVRIERVAPPGILVETASENADRQSELIRDDLGFFRIALLVFAGVALFVGAFLIFNTFSITVAQRITRVRDAAHPRRLARADPHLGRARGAADRAARVAAGNPRRDRLRCRHQVAAAVDRRRLPQHGGGAGDADDRRLADRRARRSRWCPRSGRRCARPGCRRWPRCAASSCPAAGGAR